MFLSVSKINILIEIYFIHNSLIHTDQASKENRVEKVVKHYLKYSLLIIDEIGYLPVDRNASYGFFQLIASIYTRIE